MDEDFVLKNEKERRKEKERDLCNRTAASSSLKKTLLVFFISLVVVRNLQKRTVPLTLSLSLSNISPSATKFVLCCWIKKRDPLFIYSGNRRCTGTYRCVRCVGRGKLRDYQFILQEIQKNVKSKNYHFYIIWLRQ